jgi:hypothetical protein
VQCQCRETTAPCGSGARRQRRHVQDEQCAPTAELSSVRSGVGSSNSNATARLTVTHRWPERRRPKVCLCSPPAVLLRGTPSPTTNMDLEFGRLCTMEYAAVHVREFSARTARVPVYAVHVGTWARVHPPLLVSPSVFFLSFFDFPTSHMH